MKKALILIVLSFSAIITAQTGTAKCYEDSFMPTPGERYVLSAWVKDNVTTQPTNYTGKIVILSSLGSGGSELIEFDPTGLIIDGWQRINKEFKILEDTNSIQIKLISASAGSYFDDIRIFPVNGNMKSFVYDPVNQRLMAELDENNYATYYEYDKEGGLVRVKKETERGIRTIQETRSASSKVNTQ